jgi:hypothetical protein
MEHEKYITTLYITEKNKKVLSTETNKTHKENS